MKGKLLKKLIAGSVSLAMVGSMGFVPVDASTASQSFNFEDGNKVFADQSRITSAIENDSTLNSNVVTFTNASNAQNGYSFSNYDFSSLVEGALSTTIEFDYYNTDGGRAILTLGDASVRGITGGSSKITYSNTGAIFNLGSNKSSALLNDASLTLSDYTGKWMHVKVDVDEIANTYTYSVTDKLSGNVISQTADGQTTAFLNSNAVSLSQIDIFGYINSSKCAMLDNLSITSNITESSMYDVTFDVEGTETTVSVIDGQYVTSVPETAKTGYIFKGWQVVKGDAVDLLSSDAVLATPIVGNTKYTALYEADPDYIEPMKSVSFTTYPANNLLVAGADENTAQSNPIGITITGELGKDISAAPDSRVTDFNVTYEFDGFRTVVSKNEPTTDDPSSNSYCDSYGTVTINADNLGADFALKSHPFNYYGRVKATVTYNGQTMTIEKPLAYIGNPAKANANQILPRGGYVSDFDRYEDSMLGYSAAISADNVGAADVTTDSWAAYGGNTKQLSIAEENGKKFMMLQALGTNSSCFAANQIDTVTDAQVMSSQMVRFHNAGSAILLKSANPVTWNDNATTYSISFTGTELNINSNKICDASADVWYKVVAASDVTSGKCYAYVYNADNELLGQSEVVDFTNAGSVTPKYFMYRTPDRAMGQLDFNDVNIYRAEMDSSTFTTTQADETLPVPEAGQDNVSTTLTVSAKTTEGYDMIGAASWEIADETVTGVTITPSADDSHQAVITVAAGATAGEVPVKVTLGGASKTLTLNLSSSQDSVKFTKSSASISIPMDDTAATAQYSAIVVDGQGNQIAAKDITYAMYDKNNANLTTIDGVTFDNGILTVTSSAKPATFYIRATSTNSSSETISKAIKVVIHGLAFDFGAGTDEDVVDGYTPVTADTSYTTALGYGIEGTASAEGTASLTDASTDYLNGTFTFKANVTSNKVYTVKVYYNGTAASEYVNSDLTGVALTNATLSEASYTIPVFDGVLDLAFSASQVAYITIEKTDDKVKAEKPNVYTVGDSTIANNGSWAYVLNRDQSNYPELTSVATFSNNGRGGKNLSSYYTGGEFRDRVLVNIRPGDYVMIGDMGTNGMGSSFEDDFNYYVDCCKALGAKVILNSYSPHGCVGDYAKGYDADTQTFTSYRQDSYDNIVRSIYETRKSELNGFVDIGKNADTAFNAYVDDYAANGYSSRDAAAQAIIACFGDHNHYSEAPLAAKLMIEGYNGTPGIVSSLVSLIGTSPAPTTAPTPEVTTAPTTEPTPEVTTAPTTEPTPEVTTAPTTEPTPEVTTAPTTEPTPEVTPTACDSMKLSQDGHDVVIESLISRPNVKLIKAVYDSEGRLSGVTIDTTVTALDAGTINISIGETQVDTNGYVKYILLDAENNNKPVMSALKIDAAELAGNEVVTLDTIGEPEVFDIK